MGSLKKYVAGDPQIEQLQALHKRRSNSNHDRIQLSFALGKAYGDIDCHDDAFTCFAEGNRLRKQELNYDIASDRSLFARLTATFSNDKTLANRVTACNEDGDQRPIFIVGMPRSGTTLVEQILASHSRVYGAGELDLLSQIVKTINWRSSDLRTDQFQQVRDAYLSGLAKIGAPQRFITDKLPLNFLWIGFVLNALPEAKIIHTQRDARATCWSNFKQYFSKRAEYSCDIQDVTQYYKLYTALMAFWHETFPGRIYDLNYEALTEQQEEQSRRLLEYVGLEWEDQCLEFHTSARAVTSASAMQVRQKMYTGSSQEWRKYERHLGPMIEALNGF